MNFDELWWIMWMEILQTIILNLQVDFEQGRRWVGADDDLFICTKILPRLEFQVCATHLASIRLTDQHITNTKPHLSGTAKDQGYICLATTWWYVELWGPNSANQAKVKLPFISFFFVCVCVCDLSEQLCWWTDTLQEERVNPVRITELAGRSETTVSMITEEKSITVNELIYMPAFLTDPFAFIHLADAL